MKYVRHREQPAWGVGLLVKEGKVDSVYVFADGGRRVFKTRDFHFFLDEVDPPDDADVLAKLQRGYASGGTSTPKAMNMDFVTQLRANRRDGGAFLAYADWLQGQRDPRGELIVIQHQLAKKRDPKLQAAERELLARHADYFMPRSLREILENNAGCSVVWRYGFITHVKLARRARDYVDPVDVLPDLLRHPSAEFLESLALGPVGPRAAPDFIRCLDAITEAKHALLEELICDQANGPPARTGDIAPLFAALPGLKRLELRAEGVRIATQAKHEQIRSIAIRADVKLAAAPLLKSKLSRLETLEIDMPDFTPSPAEIGALLDGKRMPALRRLVLRGTKKTRAILDAICKAPGLANLRELVLTGGDLPARSTEVGLMRVKTLAHLTVLEIDGTAEEDPRERKKAEERGIAVARATAAREGWTTLARADEIVWGERDGEAAFARLGTTHARCTCGVANCAHLAALQAVAALAHTLDEREVPAAVMRRFRR